MLYEFHRKQNAKKAGSVNATYLINGVVVVVAAASAGQSQINGDGDDIHMQSSPFMSSSAPQEESQEQTLYSRSVLLAREEDLEGEELRWTLLTENER